MKKINFITFGIILLMVILLTNLSSAAPSYCCERFKNDGPWCQSGSQTECAVGLNPFSNQNYKNVPTSCESTSYCKMGTCINQLEGSCMPNTPLVVCNKDGGLWKSEEMEDLPECQLGCCLIGNNQAAFVTLVRCKRLTAEQNQGLMVNYREDITSEAECIASVSSEEMGACVFTKDNEKTCSMITKNECDEIKESQEEGLDVGSVNFHKGYLCSAPQLGTTCGPRGGTKCYDEKVYFMDTCGNTANIYDSSKLNEDNDYWTYIQEPTCDPAGTGSKNSISCGDCDYYAGSICKAYERGESAKPSYGNSICKTLDCRYNNENYLHGESWCEENGNSASFNKTLPGKRYFRLMCYNGEVTVEPCGEFRNERCIEQEVNGYSYAGCIINRWQDCTNQTEKDICEDIDFRDCKWIEGYSMKKDENGKDLGFTNMTTKSTPGSCVPRYAPGFDFYGGEGNGSLWCSQATTVCVAVYEEALIDFNGAECIENCHCIKEEGAAEYNEWLSMMNNVCTSLGDCGNKNNYFGFPGDEKDPVTKS